MEKIIKRWIVVLSMAALPAVGWSVPLVIDEATDSYTMGIGDFALFEGTDVASAPGQVEDILQLQSSPTESGMGSLSLGDLWTTFNDSGVTAANNIAIALGVNETMGAAGFIILESLEVDFDSLDYDWTGGNLAQIHAYGPGGSAAEALFWMDLPFDFMTQYNGMSTELLSLSANISDSSDGFEIFFLSARFTDGPPEPPFCEQFPQDPQCDDDSSDDNGNGTDVPEPGTLALLGLGLLGMGLTRRKQQI